MTSKV